MLKRKVKTTYIPKEDRRLHCLHLHLHLRHHLLRLLQLRRLRHWQDHLLLHHHHHQQQQQQVKQEHPRHHRWHRLHHRWHQRWHRRWHHRHLLLRHLLEINDNRIKLRPLMITDSQVYVFRQFLEKHLTFYDILNSKCRNIRTLMKKNL